MQAIHYVCLVAFHHAHSSSKKETIPQTDQVLDSARCVTEDSRAAKEACGPSVGLFVVRTKL